MQFQVGDRIRDLEGEIFMFQVSARENLQFCGVENKGKRIVISRETAEDCRQRFLNLGAGSTRPKSSCISMTSNAGSYLLHYPRDEDGHALAQQTRKDFGEMGAAVSAPVESHVCLMQGCTVRSWRIQIYKAEAPE